MTKIEEVTARLERIEQLLLQMLKQNDCKKSHDGLLSIQQAANYLHLSVSRMYSLIYTRKLKPIQQKKNSKILFQLNELDSYLTNGSITDCLESQ